VIALVTGASGQLGRELQRTVPDGIELVAMTRADLDITDPEGVARIIDEITPEVVINAAAYTAVDQAEKDTEVAFSVNGDGPGNLAHAVARRGGRLIQVSTDFVFSGESGRPYEPEAPTGPESIYGASKLQGERQVQAELPDSSTILRTAWVYSRFGHNFAKTMLRLLSERDQLEVICDQVGTPTWAYGLAETIWRFATRPDLKGVYHWTDAGVASWYDFAIAIQDEARLLGNLQSECAVQPTTTAARPSAAPRPPYSVLEKTSTWASLGHQSTHWRAQLRRMLQEIEIDDDE
jgi:dTDP-4-dehydrorhamnose reductase